MVLFILCKLILQTCIGSRPVGLDVWFFGRTLCLLSYFMCANSKALVRLRGCTGSPVPSLVAYVVSTISHELAHMIKSFGLQHTTTRWNFQTYYKNWQFTFPNDKFSVWLSPKNVPFSKILYIVRSPEPDSVANLPTPTSQPAGNFPAASFNQEPSSIWDIEPSKTEADTELQARRQKVGWIILCLSVVPRYQL